MKNLALVSILYLGVCISQGFAMETLASHQPEPEPEPEVGTSEDPLPSEPEPEPEKTEGPLEFLVRNFIQDVHVKAALQKSDEVRNNGNEQTRLPIADEAISEDEIKLISALHSAAKKDESDGVVKIYAQLKKLLSSKESLGEIDSRLKKHITSALIEASLNNSCAAAKQSIRLGADIEVKNGDGMTLLMVASEKGYTSLAKLLIDSGAIPEAKSNTGCTPLIFAAKYGNKDIVDLLFFYANVEVNTQENFSNGSGGTALHLAARYGHVEIVKTLCEKGANVELKNAFGLTALEVSKFFSQNESIRMLHELAEGTQVRSSDASVRRGGVHGRVRGRGGKRGIENVDLRDRSIRPPNYPEWNSHWSIRHNHWYWWNINTRETRWNAPEGSPLLSSPETSHKKRKTKKDFR